MEPDRIVREKERRVVTAIGRSTAYEWERRGLYPRRVSLPGGRVGWRLSELLAWVRDRPAVEQGEAARNTEQGG